MLAFSAGALRARDTPAFDYHIFFFYDFCSLIPVKTTYYTITGEVGD